MRVWVRGFMGAHKRRGAMYLVGRGAGGRSVSMGGRLSWERAGSGSSLAFLHIACNWANIRVGLPRHLDPPRLPSNGPPPLSLPSPSANGPPPQELALGPR